MSTGVRFKREWALKLAEEWKENLSPACKRIEIAGSLRRGTENVGDIELVVVPHVAIAYDLFGAPVEDVDALEGLLFYFVEKKRLRVLKGGHRYKQLLLPEDVRLELWIVRPPAEFGVIEMIRTGSAEFAKWMVTQRSKGGALPDNFRVEGGRVLDVDDDVIPMPDEFDYFRLCGIFYEPSERTHDFTKRLDSDFYTRQGG